MSHPLNPAQARAVEHLSGPLLVLAGAGSGKTRVITHRIARLLERGVPPRAVLALTFTNKAAGEMGARVASLVGREKAGRGVAKGKKGRPLDSSAVTVTTFHSFGLGVLGSERAAVGGDFTIFDQGDSVAAVKEVLRSIDAAKRFDAAAVLSRISAAKNAFMKPGDPTVGDERDGDDYDAIAREVYPRYRAALRAFRAFDFDDLVCGTVDLWQTRPDVLQRWRDRFRYVLVDEYQDTNGAQLALVRALCAEHRNVCVVGDDDQAIYGWRGADVRNILRFEDDFPGATIIKLEQNYRSRRPILDVANAVLSRKEARHKKVLFTERAGGEPVRAACATTPEIEATWIAREVSRLVRDEGKRANEVAVLYRSNGQSKAFEEALREVGVAHRVVGGQEFFDRKEVKDVLAYLKVVVNPSDEISLRRVLNYPARGIGESSVERLALHALAKRWSLWQTIERVDALDDVPGAAREGCKEFERTIASTRDALAAGTAATRAVEDLCERIRLKKDIEQSSPSNTAAARRWSNVAWLFGALARREAREPFGPAGAAGDRTPMSWLGAYLRALTLEADEEADTTGERVTLTTLHGAKGLEWDHVFLAGCEEGLLPHARTLDARVTEVGPQDIEEERRLFYVGVTRARESLVLTRAKSRGVRGRLVPRTPSRFLVEIPAELVTTIDVVEDPSVSAAVQEQGANALLAALDALGH